MSPSLPSPIDLIQKTFEAFVSNPVGFLLSGLAMSLVGLALGIGLGVLWGGLAVLVFPALAASDSSIMGLIALLVTIVAGLASVVVSAVIPAPMQASLLRAFDLGGPGSVRFGSVFSFAQQDLSKVVLATLGAAGLTLIGLAACVLPGLLVAFALHLVLPAVALDGLSPVDAARRSWEHVSTQAGWALGSFAVLVVVVTVASWIPIIGSFLAIPLATDYLVRVYRAAYPA